MGRFTRDEHLKVNRISYRDRTRRQKLTSDVLVAEVQPETLQLLIANLFPGFQRYPCRNTPCHKVFTNEFWILTPSGPIVKPSDRRRDHGVTE